MDEKLIGYFESQVSKLGKGHWCVVPGELIIECFGSFDVAEKWFSSRNCYTTKDLTGDGITALAKRND